MKVKLEPGAKVPQKMTEHSAAFDLFAFIPEGKFQIVPPSKTLLVRTGVYLEIPNNCEGQIRSRSGLALERSIVIFNSPGTIDSDYRGEVKCMIHNFGILDFVIHNGDRIAQLVITEIKTPSITFETVDYLPDTNRGSGGFGSTGV